MKLGAQDKAKAKWAVGLLVIAIVVAIYNFGFGQKSGTAAPPVREQQTTSTAGSWKAMRDPTLQSDLLQRQQAVVFESSRNIFMMKEEKHASKPGGIQPLPPKEDPKPPVETALPIDLKFFGYFRKSGEPKTICVSQGEAIFLAQEGSVVAQRYRVLEIKNASVLVQDVLSNQQQSLALLQ